MVPSSNPAIEIKLRAAPYIFFDYVVIFMSNNMFNMLIEMSKMETAAM